MESITNHDVYLSGKLMYILLKNLDVNISDNVDVNLITLIFIRRILCMYNSLDVHVQPHM